MELVVRNVNAALAASVEIVQNAPQRFLNVAPRGAPTLEWEAPVTTIYQRPQERVLFLPERDANPFFHFFESLWMLAGRNDVAFPAMLVKRMATFSDNGETLWGAYGDRWRHWFLHDQLNEIIAILKKEPLSRRAVLAMWDGSEDLGHEGRDLPCNTHAYFKLRNGALRMTVCCRSNDIVWGAYGANAVHFSVLQEYLAEALNVRVGVYAHVSDSWHIYQEHDGGEVWTRVKNTPNFKLYQDPYDDEYVEPRPLASSGRDWESDLVRFFDTVDATPGMVCPSIFVTPWWAEVAAPMWLAWYNRSVQIAQTIGATDWRKAAVEWILRHPGVQR